MRPRLVEPGACFLVGREATLQLSRFSPGAATSTTMRYLPIASLRIGSADTPTPRPVASRLGTARDQRRLRNSYRCGSKVGRRTRVGEGWRRSHAGRSETAASLDLSERRWTLGRSRPTTCRRASLRFLRRPRARWPRPVRRSAAARERHLQRALSTAYVSAETPAIRTALPGLRLSRRSRAARISGQPSPSGVTRQNGCPAGSA